MPVGLFGSRLHDAILVTRRYTLGTLIDVRDAVTVLKQKIEFGTGLVYRVGNIGWRLDHLLI
jgi:hypothetical protein